MLGLGPVPGFLVVFVLNGLIFTGFIAAILYLALFKFDILAKLEAAGIDVYEWCISSFRDSNDATAAEERSSIPGGAAVVNQRKVRREGWMGLRRIESGTAFDASSLLSATAAATASDTASINSSSTSTSMLGGLSIYASQAREWVDTYTEKAAAEKAKKKAQQEQKLYFSLSEAQLAIYEDAEKLSMLYVIKMPMYTVSIESTEDTPSSSASSATRTKMLDAELFVKKTAIVLRLKPEYAAAAAATTSTASSPSSPGPHSEIPCFVFPRPAASSSGVRATTANGTPVLPGLGKTDLAENGGPQPFIFFSRIQSDKEDWYHDLVAASKLGDEKACEKDSRLFKQDDMEGFLDQLDSTPDLIHARVLNAALSSLFFHNYRTSPVQDYILRKLKRKIEKMNVQPSYGGFKISPVTVERIDVGSTAPLLSKFMLKQLTNEAEFNAEAHLQYKGNFVMKFSTEVTFPSLGKGKPLAIRVVLAAVVKHLEGTVCFQVKKLPSNRVWWGFTKMPDLDMEFIPEIGPKQFKWSAFTNLILKGLKEGIKDSLVAPHMDDIAFMDTSDYSQRGGIWGDALKREGDESAWNNANALATAVTGATASAAASASASTGAATDNNSATPVSNPHVDGHGLAPGVPNLKLGDSKAEGLSVDTGFADVASNQLPEGLRQRVKPSPGDRKVSDSSTTSGNPASAPPIEKQSNRKKSWFSSSTSSLPAALGAASSSSSAAVPPVPALPASTSGSSIASTKSTSDLPRTASLPVAAVAAAAGGEADGVAAVEKLRGILSDSHSTSGSTSSASATGPGTSVATSRPTSISDTASVDGYSLSPQRIISSGPLHRTPSASSDETTRSTKSKLIPGNSADGSADYAAYLEETARATTAAATAGGSSNSSSPTKSKSFGALLMKGSTSSIASSNKPSLFRKKSDKSTAATTTAADDVSTIASTTATSTSRSRTPSARSASPVESIPTTIASANTTDTSIPEIRTAADVQAAAANVLAGWKAKAQDKQAIQDGVAQAKQQMAKWGNSWKAYRKTGFGGEQQGEAGQRDMQLPPPLATASAGDVSTTDGRTRSSSVLLNSVAPNGTSGPGHIAPSAAVATTSITKPNGSSSSSGELASSTQPTTNAIRRVPPPSTVPVHPAFSIYNQPSSSAGTNGNADQYPLPGNNNRSNGQTSHGKRDSVSSSKAAYRPAAMMAVPGMTEARRFQLSSEQAAVTMAVAPVRSAEPAPLKTEGAETVDEAPEAAVPVAAPVHLPPALPTRPVTIPASSASEEKGPGDVVKRAEEDADSSSARLDDSGVDFKPMPMTTSLQSD